MKNSGLHILLALGALVAAMVIFENSGLDIAIQDELYDFCSSHWMINRINPYFRAIFYTAPKYLLAYYALRLLAVIGMSYFRPALAGRRRKAVFVLLCLAMVPAILSGSKNFNNTFCPWDIERYGGDEPYVRVFERYPEGYVQTRMGKCFPAGHASGGFALMSLAFVAGSRRKRYMAIAGGLLAGWLMGGYQMMKGAHYLSHTVVTMLGAWIIILLLYRLVLKDRDSLPT